MRKLLIVAMTLPAAACGVFETEVDNNYANTRHGTLLTTADVRVVTRRQHPEMANEVVCTEPSPDVAKVLSSALAATAKGGNGAVDAGIGISAASAGAVAELAGRSTALLGLRDGLYRACEAYSNGALGQDAYALVVSRYTQLMTTLFLAQDATGAAASGKASISSPVLQVPDVPSPANDAASKTPSAAKVATAGAKMAVPAAAAAPAAAGPAPLPGATPGKTDGSMASDSSIAKTVDNAPATSSISATTALSLVRMNEDYMHLPIFSAIIVSCVNEFDPTRYSKGGKLNPWLEKICNDMSSLKTLEEVAMQVGRLEGVPVDPVPAIVAPKSGASSEPSAAPPKKKKPAPKIKKLPTPAVGAAPAPT